MPIRTSRARGTIALVGDTPMQALIARLSVTPGVLRWPGRQLDADGDEIRATGWTTPPDLMKFRCPYDAETS